ncbi:TPA: hypothetical protein ACQZHI_004569, partial [Escherichia coli]
ATTELTGDGFQFAAVRLPWFRLRNVPSVDAYKPPTMPVDVYCLKIIHHDSITNCIYWKINRSNLLK